MEMDISILEDEDLKKKETEGTGGGGTSEEFEQPSHSDMAASGGLQHLIAEDEHQNTQEGIQELEETGKIETGSVTESGDNPLGVVTKKTPASCYADDVRDKPSKGRPNTVAVVQTADGMEYKSYNSAGIHNEFIQSTLDKLGVINNFQRKCAEVNALSRALNEGADLEGATISIAHVRGKGSTSETHGTHKDPCNVCLALLHKLNIQVDK